MPCLSVSTASSGDNTLVAAITGRVIRVKQYTLVPASSVAVKFKSGSTDISGAMTITTPLISPFGVNAMGDSEPIVETAPGEALVLNLSGAVQVSGHLVYEVR